MFETCGTTARAAVVALVPAAARYTGHVSSGVTLVLSLCVATGCGRIAFDHLDDMGVTTIAGGSQPGLQDGFGESARFENPVNVLVGPDGNIYVADHNNAAIRRVTPSGLVSTVALGAELDAVFGMVFTSDGELIAGTDFGQIVRINVATGAIVPLAQATNVPIAADDASIRPAEMAAFLARLREKHAADRAVLIVGHSNTIPELLLKLGAGPDCYGRLNVTGQPGNLLIEGYEGLWTVDLGKRGCEAIQREALTAPGPQR